METPNWKNVIYRTLEIIKNSNKGLIFLDKDSNVVTHEEAAIKKISVTPYTAPKFIQRQFTSLGLDITNKHVRIKLIALLEEYDRLKGLKDG